MRLGEALTWVVDVVRVHLIYRVRYLVLRAIGYESANPRFTDFRCPPKMIAEGVAEITARIGVKRFDIILEHACGTGRNARVLQKFADHVYGADTIPLPLVSACIERYLCLNERGGISFATMQDGLVDAIILFNQPGFDARSTWSEFLSSPNDQVAVLLHPQNFPRLLRPDGFLIFSAWEARPERRWGRMALDVIIGEDATWKYDPPALQGFELVACEFSSVTRTPFVAYRRTPQIWSDMK